MRSDARAISPLHRQGRLSALVKDPAKQGQTSWKPGVQRLPGHHSLLYTPHGYQPGKPTPLLVTLHGAGGSAEAGLAFIEPWAEKSNVMLLSPQSQSSTWDVIRGGYGPDVAAIDEALQQVFDTYSIDPDHLAIGGFSDGASYALCLGQTNGDKFSHIVGFSPGFSRPATLHGRPPSYISHGSADRVLNIDSCSRRIVPRLRQQGYPVRYEEFDGPHTVPADSARHGLDFMLAPPKEAGKQPAQPARAEPTVTFPPVTESHEELLQRPVDELQKLLADRGISCDGCLEKVDFVDRIEKLCRKVTYTRPLEE